MCTYSRASRPRGDLLLAGYKLLQPFVIITPPQKACRYNFPDTQPVQIPRTSTVSPSLDPGDFPTRVHRYEGTEISKIRPTRVHPPASIPTRVYSSKRANINSCINPDLPRPGGKNKPPPLSGSTRSGKQSRNSTLLPHIENLYKGVGGK